MNLATLLGLGSLAMAAKDVEMDLKTNAKTGWSITDAEALLKRNWPINF